MEENPYHAESATSLHAERGSDAIVEAQVVPPRPWGAWPTIGLSLASGVAVVVGQTIGALGVLLLYLATSNRAGSGNFEALVKELESDGLAIAVGSIGGGVVGIACVVLWSHLRGWTWQDYLAITPFGRRDAVVGLIGLVALIVVLDGSTVITGRELVPEVMVHAYQTAGFLPLFWFALIVAAPVWEELLFRGFMHRGLVAGWGTVPAIIICSACWAALHLQYDFINIFSIFVVGLLLGAVRQKSGSTCLAILLHALMNLVATIETAIIAA